MASGIPNVERNIEGILITLRRSGLYFVWFTSSFSVGAVLAKARAHNHRWLPLRGAALSLCVTAKSVVMDPPHPSLCFEHDLRANASRLSRGKSGLHPSGRSPRAWFSGSCFGARRCATTIEKLKTTENQNNGGICATLSGPRNTAPLTKRSGNDRAFFPSSTASLPR